MLFWISAVVRAAPYVLASLVYLRRLLDPPAPETTPVGEPYEPPFLGGQCFKLYNVQIPTQRRIVVGGDILDFTFNIFNILGPIKEIRQYTEAGAGRIQFVAIDRNGNQIFSENGGGIELISFSYNVIPQVGADDCGNIGNPNPAPSVNGDGIGGSSAPDVIGGSSFSLSGAPLGGALAIGGAIAAARAAIAAAIAAAKAAANALAAIGALGDAIGAIGDAVGKIGEILDKIKERQEEEEKRDEDKQDILRYEFGSIEKDGFLRLYPNENTQKLKAKQLDLIILSIPVGYGKYFGKLSPNFYRFKELGYIAFVSPAFGIIEYKKIEFTRSSFQVPDAAIGFFYHLGLDGSIKGNVSAFYTKPKA